MSAKARKPDLPAYMDCPPRPACEWTGGSPVQWSGRRRDHEAMGHRLFCPSCGYGWVGTDDELAQAVRALIAWCRHPASGYAEHPLPDWLEELGSSAAASGAGRG